MSPTPTEKPNKKTIEATIAKPDSAGENAFSAKDPQNLLRAITSIISETNGISLMDTLDLLIASELQTRDAHSWYQLQDFRMRLFDFQKNSVSIELLIEHPVAKALFEFFRRFPLHYQEEHTHLTGSLDANFIFPRLKKLLAGPHRKVLEREIKKVYGDKAFPINTADDVDRLIRVRPEDRFDKYLQLLFLPKLILIDRESHEAAAYHMAKELYHAYNIGRLRLKFTFSRSNSTEGEQLPWDSISSDDVVLGLYDGFMKFKREVPRFDFILSPSFRKESDFFDSRKFKSKREHFLSQVDEVLSLLDRYPELAPHLCEVDTVGNETNFFSKNHFNEMKIGFRKLQYRGFKIRSHHGETWRTLRKGIQAVDNAMNIWRVDTIEHGLSLGINPNYYYHSLFQRAMRWNRCGESVREGSVAHYELTELEWNENTVIPAKIVSGERLTPEEEVLFVKAKFHTAREVESYQHDVLNRMLSKEVTVVALPSSNKKLTGYVEDFKDHPFSWWEKKGVDLGVGTDNYVTLDTNFIREMLILLFTDPLDLKITKLLMVVTGETRRPYLSHVLWKMRKTIA